MMFNFQDKKNKESGFSIISILMSIAIGSAIIYSAMRTNNFNYKTLFLMNKNDVILEVKKQVIESLDCAATIRRNNLRKCDVGKKIAPVTLVGSAPKDLFEEYFGSSSSPQGVYKVKDVYLSAQCDDNSLSLFYGTKKDRGNTITWSSRQVVSVCRDIEDMITQVNSDAEASPQEIQFTDQDSEYIIEHSEITFPIQLKKVMEYTPYAEGTISYTGNFTHTYSIKHKPYSLITSFKYNYSVFTQMTENSYSAIFIDVIRGGTLIDTKKFMLIKNLGESYSGHLTHEIFLKLIPKEKYTINFRFESGGSLTTSSRFYFLPESKITLKDYI